MCEVRHLKMLYIDRRVDKRVLYGKDAVDKTKVSEKRKKLQEEANVIIDVTQFQEDRSSSTSPTKDVQITTNDQRVNKTGNNWNSSLLPMQFRGMRKSTVMTSILITSTCMLRSTLI